jgi:hypothetical protein
MNGKRPMNGMPVGKKHPASREAQRQNRQPNDTAELNPIESPVGYVLQEKVNCGHSTNEGGKQMTGGYRERF